MGEGRAQRAGHRVLGDGPRQLVGADGDRRQILDTPAFGQLSSGGGGEPGRQRNQKAVDRHDDRIAGQRSGVVPAIRVGFPPRTLGDLLGHVGCLTHGRSFSVGSLWVTPLDARKSPLR